LVRAARRIERKEIRDGRLRHAVESYLAGLPASHGRRGHGRA
jgi:hypothetical protein